MNNIKKFVSSIARECFSSQYLTYFWIPRIALAIACYIFYDNAHLLMDKDIIPNSASTAPDELVYINSFNFNPFYALSLQAINTLPFSSAIKIIISTLSSGISALSIIKIASIRLRFKKNLAALLVSINPFLVLYSLKFCTENFLLAGLAIFIAQNLNNARNTLQNKLKSFSSQLLIYLARAQSFPLFAYEAMELFRQRKALNPLRKESTPQKISMAIILISALILPLAIFSSRYISMIMESLWTSNYILKPADIYQYLNQINVDWPLIHELNILFSFVIYIFVSIAMIMGARGRLTDLPWQIDIFNVSIGSNLDHINQSSDYYLELIKSTNNSEILIKLILPSLFFVLVHGIGTYRWIMANAKIKENLVPFLYPYTLIIVPILFFPYMRYFYPLMPFAMIGLSLTKQVPKCNSLQN